MGTLYVVATPIGNVEDISPRAVRVLSAVSLVAAEDTRHTGRLFARLGVKTPLVSYHAHNERARRDQLLEALAAGDVALVSAAGTPGISEPGRDLVVAAAASGHTVSPVPGASAITAAIGVSGLVTGLFLSLGFLPRDGSVRRVLIARAGTSGFPVVLFEAPGRVADSLTELGQAWGDREAVVMRELTKRHEEIIRGTLTSLAARFSSEPPRGEVVLVVAGIPHGSEPADSLDEAIRLLTELRRAGLTASRAAKEAAVATGRSRSELYRLATRQEDVDLSKGGLE